MTTRRQARHIPTDDSAAFADLVRRHQGPVFGYLGRLGLSRADAEEVAQEAFVRVWRNAERFDPARASLTTWLFTIVRNLAMNALAQPQRRHHLPIEGVGDVADDGPDPEQATVLAERKRILRHALRRLPPADRSVLALSYFRELDLAAIARIEGCSEAAAKQRLYRARIALRRLLENRHE
ncbi:MAG: sigma-70 family RNA polymerase sigma factor [Zoogloeaceae bacterium]|nr:sigma-70 family RNA polymerase sigma factor [Rhodocyclaceae bacterium]MCP5236901.1 sigma-70 family RNA polymerase sigma factor [Zoogloeaceae bacterium]